MRVPRGHKQKGLAGSILPASKAPAAHHSSASALNMSGQQYEQKAAQIPGALGREIASSEEWAARADLHRHPRQHLRAGGDCRRRRCRRRSRASSVLCFLDHGLACTMALCSPLQTRSGASSRLKASTAPAPPRAPRDERRVRSWVRAVLPLLSTTCQNSM